MSGLSLTRKLIQAHLVEGHPRPGEEIALHIDQALTRDATGALVMLAGGLVKLAGAHPAPA